LSPGGLSLLARMDHTNKVELVVEAVVGCDQVPEVTNGIRDVKRLVAICAMSQSQLRFTH
jgi:hypothetical protein